MSPWPSPGCNNSGNLSPQPPTLPLASPDPEIHFTRCLSDASLEAQVRSLLAEARHCLRHPELCRTLPRFHSLSLVCPPPVLSDEVHTDWFQAETAEEPTAVLSTLKDAFSPVSLPSQGAEYEAFWSPGLEPLERLFSAW